MEEHETWSVSGLIKSPLMTRAIKVSIMAESQGERILLKAANSSDPGTLAT